MIQDTITETLRINARKADAFDIFNVKHYIGPNPYLDTAALVFDFAFTGYLQPLPVEKYAIAIADRYPQLRDESYESYAQLFGRVVSEVGKLDMGLHLKHWSVKPSANYERVAIETLHARTTRSVAYSVWDWFEAITQGQDFPFEEQIKVLQNLFRQSVYGGPTVYALLRTASEKGIPTFYLWDEGLMQYGYGKIRYAAQRLRLTAIAIWIQISPPVRMTVRLF